jgi:hypothetical protein
MGLVWLGVAVALGAATPKPPAGAPVCAPAATRPIFLSPMGEPFRGTAGQPYPSAAWFKNVDRDGDGRVTRVEFEADAARFFARIDTDHDGRLTPEEVATYERDIAPETSIYGRGGLPRDDRRRSSRRGRASYGGPLGAGQ